MTTPERFDDVMDRLASRVYTLARYTLASADDAEDVTQEVFTRLWEHRATIDLDRVEGWLIRATSNACVDFRRRRAARRAHESAAADRSTSEPAPSARLESAELRDRVTRAIAALDEPFRSILVLREIEGSSYQEIADGLQLSMSQVKVYLHRARARLADHLAPLRDTAAISHPEGAVHVP